MRLEIICQDRLGIAQDVLDILVAHNIDLRGIEIDAAGKIFLNFPSIEFADFQHLMPKIRRIDGIEDVKTTAFMPVEREKHQLKAILQTLPDPVFSIDSRGIITQVNDAIEVGLSITQQQVIGKEIGDIVKGFNFAKWLDSKEVLAQAFKLKFADQDYLADILPIFIHDSQEDKILAGAVIILKSEVRLGQQLSAFNRPQTAGFDAIIKQSVAMKRVITSATHVAATDNPVLLLGENGCGKKTLAKACHSASARSEHEPVFFDTVGLTEEQVAAQLFGRVESTEDAATVGLLEQADGGTLIMSDIAEISVEIQGRILRLIEHGKYSRQGEVNERTANVRIIACSSYDLHNRMDRGLLRDDLYYRLTSMAIMIPPLRERRADILPLADNIIQKKCVKLGRHRARLSKAAADYLLNYPWPGNIDQLEKTIERVLASELQQEISVESLQLPTNATKVSFIDENFEGSLDQEVKNFEKELLQRLYPFYPSTRQLAKKLGLSHTAIANKLRDYGISRSGLKK
ncbi:sigma 54-interacting transcriptional regulator [Alteromonas sp. ASW11-36]|uniref:HTH-type transcriptional regulatory protein TyrR n=1 Tax=Alteromonas arenosi TaxID=3055817 RepID=A0ABT7SV59_9ALTE|nr:sigma 54-interacting transcriptional regulator [Alteromonas sp. ASW11-36]MDM7860078.1 sigma 54-interacting transcriptional regulator [Alteromonas sp. ASW11-36]